MKKIFIKNPSVKMQYGDPFFSPAVRLRRKFSVEKKERAVLSVCGLGYGYYYLNGKPVSGDLLTAPVSDYSKTLWVNTYDVTHLLKEGENVLCIHLGNGYYNENLKTAWEHNAAHWRDVPKVCLQLRCGELMLTADTNFKTSVDKATYYNQLHVGEFYDANEEEQWLLPAFDDSGWENAVVDENPPQGALRVCTAPPILEFESYPCVAILQNDKGYVLDFGQNFSGYLRIKVSEPKGTLLTIEHAEQIDENNRLKLNDLDLFYKPFQIDKITCSGKAFTWSPRFTYHGFRYVQISGLNDPPKKEDVQGVFVHQAIERKSSFECAYPLLNQIYNAGLMSSWSNMHYVLTDCPTREKLGWTNDAAASCEQLFYNFEMNEFMKKWGQDICDAVEKDGSTYGIIPSHGWGHDLGPVTDAFMYKMPYYHYLHYRDKSILELMLPACLRNLRYAIEQFENRRAYWLGDWTGFDSLPTPTELIFAIYLIEFMDKVEFMLSQMGQTLSGDFPGYREKYKALVEGKYIRDGISTVEEQTAICMLICHNFGDRERMAEQLERVIIEKDSAHLHVGMVGIQYVFEALSKVGKQDLLLEMLSQPTAPSFQTWFDEGATTLYENFTDGHTNSKNHHMFSAVLAWIIKYVLGVQLQENGEIKIAPLSFEKIKSASGKVKIYGKEISVVIRDGNVQITEEDHENH